jgi:hypothetical protein
MRTASHRDSTDLQRAFPIGAELSVTIVPAVVHPVARWRNAEYIASLPKIGAEAINDFLAKGTDDFVILNGGLAMAAQGGLEF